MTDLIPAHLAWLRARGVARRTIEEREGVLRRAHNAFPLGVEFVVEQDIIAFLANDRWSPATRNVYWRHLYGFYGWAVRFEHLDRNPMENLPCPPVPPSEPRPVSPGQLAELFDRLPEPFLTAAVLAVGAGLRCMEIAALRREDITEESIYLREAKGGRRASVPTAPEVWAWVRDFPPGSIVAHVGGKPDARWVSIRSAVYINRKLRMPGVSLHRLRSEFAYRLRRAGADAFVIQRALRHASLRTTQRYVGASEEECRAAIRTLPLLGPKPRQDA